MKKALGRAAGEPYDSVIISSGSTLAEAISARAARSLEVSAIMRGISFEGAAAPMIDGSRNAGEWLATALS